METPLSMATGATCPADNWTPKTSDGTSLASGQHCSVAACIHPNRANQNLECTIKSDSFNWKNGSEDEFSDADTVFESLHFNSPRRSSSHVVSDHHYDSDDTPWDSEDEQHCDDGLSNHPCAISLSTSNEVILDDPPGNIIHDLSLTVQLSRSASVEDTVSSKLSEAGDDEDLTPPLGFVPPTNKQPPATPPPSPSCLLPEGLTSSIPIFREPQNQRDILATSPGAVAAAFAYCTETIPSVEDHINAPTGPELPCLTPISRPGHQLTPSSHCSTASSSSEHSIFILPAIPRLYYKHSSTNSSTNWCNWSNLLTNPLNRLKARKRSVKESAAMDAELRQAHAEMRRRETLCREGLVGQGEPELPRYADLVKPKEGGGEGGETRECRTGEEG